LKCYDVFSSRFALSFEEDSGLFDEKDRVKMPERHITGR
jgi:hypothetical protein